MKSNINRYLFSFMVFGLILILTPPTTFAKSISDINNLFVVTQQNTTINYEKSQPSSIDNPVVDPNFNVMRSKDTESSTATYIVIGLLIAATIIPLATWWYFSK
ncbi:fusion glycoprotein F0 [Prochlorococcus marinus str. MU1404]|uniref:fusion glycoprotein F0 n=1 Tax=Prochlorococcus marinus TaxID=1219 RepID=UPI001ADC8F11|nr:fusion glycoprotein F0 [Prochlorococcus marinus]MBO8230028.1 fusion glycoprotein F0 [Prochlorococcus marinus XMU1404]MBW3073198.1 fusion glycoprotein F0 [Prochlorococcus marinus str. MU1404]MCR8545635.1 fusion glycoprotein F0 [Prochlorococcus marinus CUG1432]